MFFFCATDLKSYKQHTKVIGHGFSNYPLMEAKNIALTVLPSSLSSSFSYMHERSVSTWLGREMIQWVSGRDIKVQMNMKLPVFINRHTALLEINFVPLDFYYSILWNNYTTTAKQYWLVTFFTALRERSSPIKELSYKALRETWPTCCAKTNPIIRGCHRFEVQMLSSLSFSELPPQSTGDGFTWLPVCLKSTGINMQLPVRSIPEWKCIPTIKGGPKLVCLSG